jgi:hypothetical protein
MRTGWMFSRAVLGQYEVAVLFDDPGRSTQHGPTLQAPTGIMITKAAEHRNNVEVRTLSHLSKGTASLKTSSAEIGQRALQMKGLW